MHMVLIINKWNLNAHGTCKNKRNKNTHGTRIQTIHCDTHYTQTSVTNVHVNTRRAHIISRKKPSEKICTPLYYV